MGRVSSGRWGRWSLSLTGASPCPTSDTRGYHIFGSDGEFERLVRFPGGLPSLNPVLRAYWRGDERARILRADRSGNLFSRMARTTRVSESESTGGVMSARGEAVEGPRQVERILLDGDEARTEIVVTGWNPPGPTRLMAFAPKFLFDALPGGGVAYSDSSAYTIKIADPAGKVVRLLRRAFEARLVSDDIRRDYTRIRIDASHSALSEELTRHGGLVKEMLERAASAPRALRESLIEDIIENVRFYPEIPLVDDLRATWERDALGAANAGGRLSVRIGGARPSRGESSPHRCRDLRTAAMWAPSPPSWLPCPSRSAPTDSWPSWRSTSSMCRRSS